MKDTLYMIYKVEMKGKWDSRLDNMTTERLESNSSTSKNKSFLFWIVVIPCMCARDGVQM